MVARRCHNHPMTYLADFHFLESPPSQSHTLIMNLTLLHPCWPGRTRHTSSFTYSNLIYFCWLSKLMCYAIKIKKCWVQSSILPAHHRHQNTTQYIVCHTFSWPSTWESQFYDVLFSITNKLTLNRYSLLFQTAGKAVVRPIAFKPVVSSKQAASSERRL